MRKRLTLAAALLAGLVLAPPAHAEITGFRFEGLSAASDDFSLDDRIGASQGATEHIVNIEDCEAYRGKKVRLTWGITPVPVSGEEYTIKVAGPGSSCPTDDMESDGDNDDCTVVEKRGDPSSTGNTVDVDLDDLTGGACDSGNRTTSTIYVLYEYQDAVGSQTIASHEVDFIIDLEPPVAPTGVEALPGESSIHVSWEDDANTEDPEDIRYRAYYRAGAPIETIEDADDYATSGQGSTSVTITGLDTSETYYVRVSAVDDADNEGPLSDATDISTTTVPVTDWWEHYKEEGGAEEGGFCFIATAAWGTPLAGEVVLLREFRDGVLLRTGLGRAFVEGYYQLSPPLARAIRHHPALGALVRVLLGPALLLVWFAMKLGLLGKLAVLLGLWGLRRTLRSVLDRRYGTRGPRMLPLPLTLPSVEEHDR